mgnify:FL=1
MKRIVLCGSRTFKDYIIQLGYKLEKEGYEVVIPKEFFVPMPKREHSMLHFSEIQNERTDYVLVVNEEKNGKKNYVGANSFAEIAMGFYFGKTVFLKNDIYKPFADELVGWGVIPLKGNLEEIKEYK